MIQRTSIPPLWQVTRHLAAVASGRLAPDLVLTGARVLSTYSERLLEGREVWIAQGRIAAVRPAGDARRLGLASAVEDVAGGILAPGLVDPHVHVESSMMTVCAYAEAALLNGTTTLFCDSHEIGNVCDVEGIEWMLEDARRAPLNVFLTVPSTVPATNPTLETAGGDLTPSKVGALFDRWPEAVALGEKMDFIPVVLGDERSHGLLAEALRRGRPVCGHVYGREFVAAYAASGVTDTHEAIDRDIASDFLDAGLWVFLRGGNPATPWHSLPQAIRAVTELGASTQRVCVCTDDRDADDLFLFGLDWVVREAIRAGVPREVAWSMGSLHPATRYAMDAEFGALGPSRRADIVLLNDDLQVRSTWYGGTCMVRDGRVTDALADQLSHHRYRYPAAAYQTVRIPDAVPLIPAIPDHDAIANVIRVALPGILTFHERLPFRGGLPWDEQFKDRNLCFVTVVERHHGSGRVGHGFLQGLGLRSGAVASSVGHDAHNIILAGTNEPDLRLALDTLRRSQGGVVVVDQGTVKAHLPLPIAGLMSDAPAQDVRRQTIALKQAWEATGCILPYMGFNLIPLSVIPELRITDRGLVHVHRMEVIPLWDEAPAP
ncbi:MAG: adenine deaminase C-terminal domain-containing protein [Verrucomicrobiota bacterium]|jgi:adenine deaminase